MRQSIATCVLVGLLSLNGFSAATPNKQTDEIMTSKGVLRLTPLYHGSVMLEFDGKIIHIDPWSQADYTGLPQADLILSTHTHADHVSGHGELARRRPAPGVRVVRHPVGHEVSHFKATA